MVGFSAVSVHFCAISAHFSAVLGGFGGFCWGGMGGLGLGPYLVVKGRGFLGVLGLAAFGQRIAPYGGALAVR